MSALRCPSPCCASGRCSLVIELSAFPRELVDAAVEAVAETYTVDGVAVWWTAWYRCNREERERRLRAAPNLTGQIVS